MAINYKIHILGASGAGTTTLSSLLAERLKVPHLDTDEYYWFKTDIPYTEKRGVNERVELLRTDLEKHSSWVLSGSLCGWGDFAITMFTLAVFLWIPHELRMARLREREINRFGLEAISPGGWFHDNHQEFMSWAEKYDLAGTDMRSRALHEQWLSKLPCKTIRFEQPLPTLEQAARVEEVLDIR
jgi:adenylate kinase family enzyme